MMRSTVTGSLRFRWVILFLAAVLMGLGLVQVRHAAVDVFPEFAPWARGILCDSTEAVVKARPASRAAVVAEYAAA